MVVRAEMSTLQEGGGVPRTCLLHHPVALGVGLAAHSKDELIPQQTHSTKYSFECVTLHGMR